MGFVSGSSADGVKHHDSDGDLMDAFEVDGLAFFPSITLISLPSKAVQRPTDISG